MKVDLNDLTVILPAYNSASTLPQTLRSLHPSLERGMRLILVDDASQDATGQIMRDFAAFSPNIRVLSLPVNIGLGAARNVAMPQVETRLTGFMDGDDWVAPEFFGALVDRYKAYPDLDFLRCHYTECHGARRRVVMAAFPVVDKPFDPRLAINPVDSTSLVDQPHAWAGLYATDFLRREAMDFLPLRTAEDRKFVWQRQLLGRSCLVASEHRIFYRRGAASSLTQIGDERQLDFIPAMAEMMAFVLGVGIEDFYHKAARQTLSIVHFHIEKKARLDSRLHDRLCGDCRTLIKLIPPDILATALKGIDAKRRSSLKELAA
jgi:hypothetical protein